MLACGHAEKHVSVGKCWGCHIAHLRATSDDERAQRLEFLRRKREEHRLDFGRFISGLLKSYEERGKGETIDMARLRATITYEYEADPESYRDGQYPDMSPENMAAIDQMLLKCNPELALSQEDLKVRVRVVAE